MRARLQRLDRKLLLASLAIAVGVVLIAIGLLRSVSGDEVTQLPDAIESITPRPTPNRSCNRRRSSSTSQKDTRPS